MDISILLKNCKVLIMDLKEDYEQVMRKLDFAYQYCTFHLIKNLTINLKLKITEEMGKYEAESLKKNSKNL